MYNCFSNFMYTIFKLYDLSNFMYMFSRGLLQDRAAIRLHQRMMISMPILERHGVEPLQHPEGIRQHYRVLRVQPNEARDDRIQLCCVQRFRIQAGQQSQQLGPPSHDSRSRGHQTSLELRPNHHVVRDQGKIKAARGRMRILDVLVLAGP